MNCDAARRRLLGDEHPDRPSDVVRRHLAACPPCRAWSRRLVLVERQIPRLSVPPSSAKVVFVRRFLRQGGPVVTRVPRPWPTPVKERGLRKLSLAVAIAAVLAFFALGLWSWPHVAPPPRPEPSWVAEVHKERDRIRALAEPSERVSQSAALAEGLRVRARTLARDGDADGLNRLVQAYEDVVEGDLTDHARELPAARRVEVLKSVATGLTAAESEFSRLAAEQSVPATSGPLRRLAFAAQDGGRTIQTLLKGT